MAVSSNPQRRPRVLVLGATGMLGHKLVQRLSTRGLSVAATICSATAMDTAAAHEALRCAGPLISDIDVLQDEALARAFDLAEPDVVINAVGVIKQLEAAKQPIPSILTNSLLPHRVAAMCSKSGTRMISSEHGLRLLRTQGSLQRIRPGRRRRLVRPHKTCRRSCQRGLHHPSNIDHRTRAPGTRGLD